MPARRDFPCDRRGGLTVQFALYLGVAGIFGAILANLTLNYHEIRQLQSATDIAALELATTGPVTPERVRTILIAQGLNLDELTIIVSQGNYDSTRSHHGFDRYSADTAPINAVRVDITKPVREIVGAGWLNNPHNMSVSSVARRNAAASVAMGSRLLRLEDGLSGALLSATLGYDGAIEVMDYEALLDIDINMLSFLDALNTDLDLEAANYQEILDSDLTLGAVTSAIQAARLDGLNLPEFTSSLEYAGREVNLGPLIALGRHGPMEPNLSTDSAPLIINGGFLMFAGAALADGDRQVDLNLDAIDAIAELDVLIGEQAQLMQWDLSATQDDILETSQTRIRLTLLGQLSGVLGTALEIQLANAQARVSDIVCDGETIERVEVIVTTSPSRLLLDAPLTGTLTLDLSDYEENVLSFSAEDIAERTPKTVRSGLGVNVNDVSLLARPIVRIADNLLEEFGLHIGEADVWVTAAYCTRTTLVL